MSAYLNTETGEYPVHIGELRLRLSSTTSLPEHWTPDAPWVSVADLAPPAIDADTQNLSEGAPALVGGQWTRTWVVTDASAEEIAARKKARVPTSITPRQFERGALATPLPNGTSLLDTIETFVATLPREVQIDYRRAGEFRRDYPLLVSAAEALGIGADALDSYFIAWSKL